MVEERGGERGTVFAGELCPRDQPRVLRQVKKTLKRLEQLRQGTCLACYEVLRSRSNMGHTGVYAGLWSRAIQIQGLVVPRDKKARLANLAGVRRKEMPVYTSKVGIVKGRNIK